MAPRTQDRIEPPRTNSVGGNSARRKFTEQLPRGRPRLLTPATGLRGDLWGPGHC